jgi:hypothetical protein
MPMPETKPRPGRPRALTPGRRARLLDAMRGGMSLTQAATYMFVNRASIHRELGRDDELRAAVEGARVEGTTNKKETAMSSALTEADPSAQVARLETERQRAAYDASVGVAGADARLRTIEGALAEARAAVERAALVEQERAHREEQRVVREQEAERKRIREDIKRFRADYAAACVTVEKDLTALVESVSNARDLAQRSADAEHRLRRVEGDQNSVSNVAWAGGPVSDRVLHRLGIDAGLRDIRAFPGLGERPLTEVEQ